MIRPNAAFKLTDRQQVALTNYAGRKGLDNPTVKGTLSVMIAETEEYKELEPKPGNNGEGS